MPPSPRHCQDPVIFRALGDVGGKSLLDLACGDGFYTRKFRRAAADPVVGVDLSPQQIAKARRIEEREPLGIEYLAADVVSLELEQRFDVVTAIHLLHYLEAGTENSSTTSLSKWASRPSGTNRSSARRAWNSMGRHSSRTTSPTRKANSC